MNPQNDPGAVFVKARPDDASPPSDLDVKQAVREGYRVRRRRRALVGGTASAGVAAVAAVLALSLTGLPGTDETPEGTQAFPAGEGFDFDPEQAGYPHSPWGTAQPRLQEAADEHLGALAVEAGFLDAEALERDQPSDDEITAMMEEHDLDYYSALSELGYQAMPLQFEPYGSTAQGGQVNLRSYVAHDGDEEAERSSFTVTSRLPGGWTAEPGPTGDVAFPQHLISDEAFWTEAGPEFTTEDLEDGRTLMVADHGCALEAAVVYPNGSALTSTWDLDCEGQGRGMTVEDLTAAMLAMPQIDYDTSELAPVGDLIDFPPGWPYDEDWEAAADADAQASFNAALDALDAAHPGVELLGGQAAQSGADGELSTRIYTADYRLSFDDTAGNPVNQHVRYFLPGGWTPGLPPEGSTADVYLVGCGGEKDDTCTETEVDGRTVATRTFGVGESVSHWIVVYDPAGWAVELNTDFYGPIEGYDLESLIALTATLPAPVYDADEYDRD